MAGTFDVAGRLAEGQPAVDDFARYTSACQALGACGHDLTDRVERSYASEAGLDLHALDADHAALRAAVAAVRDAQQLQDSQLNALSAAWTGAGADAAAEFLRQHSAASAQVVTALSAAADQVGALRDELWRLVDAKVAAAEAVDARTDGVRGEWLAAADTVTTGIGDRAAASELVDAQVKPFVAQDVRAEWVAAMEAASEAIANRFDNATAAVRGEVPVSFPSPGQSWGPGFSAPAYAPAAPPVPGSPPMTEPAAAVPTTPMPPTPPMPSAGAMPDMGAMPGMGAGLSGASGLSGLGQQLGEVISGLVPSVGDALGDLPEPEDLELDDEPEDDEPEHDEPEDELADKNDETEAETEEPENEETQAGEGEPEPEEPAEVATPELMPEPEPSAPTPPPAAPLAAPVAPTPEPTAGTPCEIAADELPQVGE